MQVQYSSKEAVELANHFVHSKSTSTNYAAKLPFEIYQV